MARHNREGTGVDQRGFEYRLSYQPDWLRHIKVTRLLPTGRQSTKTLFRNPASCREREPGERVRTWISCVEQGVDIQVSVRGDRGRVQRMSVTCEVPSVGGSGTEELTFTLENGLPPG